MNWLNLNVSVLDSPEFLGCEPTERATWLCLLRYCIGQENGGLIAGCLVWKDRQWQQLVRVTAQEALTSCALWKWEGDNLRVLHYPSEKESEIKTKREHGKRGGRPRKSEPEKKQNVTIEKPPAKPNGNHMVMEVQNHQPISAKTERNRKEEKEKGKEKELFPSASPDDAEFLIPESEEVSQAKLKFTKPADPDTDKRHHEITSQFGTVFQDACFRTYPFSGKDAAALKRFLIGWKGTSEEFLETASKILETGRTNKFAALCRRASTIADICANWAAATQELASLADPSKAITPPRDPSKPIVYTGGRVKSPWD